MELGARTAGGGPVTLSDCVSITEVSTAAGWIAGLAIVALIATGWRKPARATADPARARWLRRPPTGIELSAVKAPFDSPTRWWRRLWAVIASSVLALWVGAIVATTVAFGVAWIVITLTGMLKK